MDEKQNLITSHELVERAKAKRVNFGKGSVTNRLRYYTKTGLIPHATRKQVGDNSHTQAHYPAYTVDLLVIIQELKVTGTPINDIKRIMTEEQLKYTAQQASAQLGKEVAVEVKKPAYNFNFLGEDYKFSPATVFTVTFLAFIAFYTFLYFNHTPSGQKLAGALFVKKTVQPSTYTQIAEVAGIEDENEGGSITTSNTLTSVTYYFPSSDNLLYNPSFEKGLGADGIDAFGNQKFGQAWKWDYSGSAHAGNVYVSDGSVRTGGLSLKFWDSGLDNNTTGAFETLGVTQPASTALSGRNYNLTLFVRTQSITGSPALRLGLRKSGSSDVYKDFPLTLSGDSYANWKQVSHTFENVEVGMFPFIEVVNYAGGVLYLEDASKVEVAKTTSLAGGTSDSSSSLVTGSLSSSFLGFTGSYTFPATNTLLGGGSVEVDIYGNVRPTDDGIGNLGGADNRFSNAYFKTVDITESINIEGSVSVDDVGSSLNPTDDNEYDLGSGSNEWRNLYVDGTAYLDNIVLDDGGLVDLSAIIHDDTAPQGLRLPQNTVLTAPSSGEGYIAWDTDANTLQVFNGSTWNEVTGGGGGSIDGTGVANYVAYWSDTNTLTNEQYLATSRGGTGISTASSTGVPSISTGTWSVAATLGATLGGTGISTGSSTGVPSISSGTWSVAGQLALSLGGTGASLGDPGVDSILFWDDGGTTSAWLAPDGTSIEISGTTLQHFDTSAQSSSDNSGVVVIQDITLDTYGHLTGLATVDLSSSFDNYSSWTLAGDTGSSAISSAGTATFTGGTNLTSAESSGTLTMNLDDNVSLAGTTGLTLSGTGGEIAFAFGETIDNDSDGTVAITAPTTSTSGNLTVAGTTGLTLSGTGGEIAFAFGETIDNDADGTVVITSPTTSLSGDLIVSGGELYLTPIASSGSTTEGTLYYDSDNDNLYVYADGGFVDLTVQGGAGYWTQTTGVLYPSTGTDDLAIGGTDATADFFVSDSGVVTYNASTTGTLTDYVLETEWTTGDLINVDWASSTTQTAAITGIDIDFANLTNDNATNLYGIRVDDFTSAGAGGDLYGLYVQGANWDYGIYSDDDVYFGGDATVAGGELYLTPISTSGSTTEGTLYYDSDNDNLYVYADGGFVDLTVQGGAGYWTQTTGVLYPSTGTDDLAIGGTDATADFFVADNGKMTFNASTTGTYVDFVLETEWTTGDLINVDWASSTTQTAAITGIDIDFANLTNDNATNLYGIRVDDFTSAGAGGDLYGLYVQGSNWDYGIYSDDDVYFGGDTTIAGTTGLSLTGSGGELAFANGETIDNDANGSIVFSEATNSITFDLDATNPDITSSTGTIAIGSIIDLNNALNLDSTSTTAFTLGDGSNTYFTFDGSTDVGDTLFSMTGASSGIDSGNILSLVADTITTGNAFTMSADALTTGEGLYIESTSTVLASGGHLALLEWNPGSADSTDADLVSINVNGNATVSGDLFNVQDDGSDLFSVAQTGITSAVPHSFTAAGDVKVAYDLVFTNQVSSTIEAWGPLTIEAGESFENNDLTLTTYGTGDVVFDLSGTGSLHAVGTDTSIVLDTTTATDTDFWIGVQDDAGGDDDDTFEIGDGTTPGTNTFLSIGTTGLTTLTGLAGSDALTITAGDAVLSDGSLTLTDADNAATLSVANDTATTIGVGAAGGVNVLSSTTLTTGDLLELQLTEGTLAGGFYLSAWDVTGSASVFNIGEDGNTVIAGSGDGTDAITLTTGDITITDGDLNVSDGDLNVTLGASDLITIDAEVTDNTGTTGIIDIDLDSAPTGDAKQAAIDLDIETITDSASVDTIVGLDILATQNSTDNDVLYGIRIQDLAGTPDVGNEYAIYQAGTNWDRGLVVEDVAELTGQVSLGSEGAFGGTDTDPSVAAGSYFTTDGTAQTLTDFDDGIDGMILIIESTDATVFDCATAGPLLCGDNAEDITTADNDTTMWINNGGDGGVWHLISYVSATTQQTGADLAEWYVSTEELVPGDVVSIDPNEEVKINRTTTAYDNKAIGVVSTQPGLVLGEIEANAYLVGLVGRVPVKVSETSEPISAGDYLTTSAEAGKAMKATHAGPMIGKALSSWSPSPAGGPESETVMTFLNVGWADPASSTAPLFALDGSGEVLGANDTGTEAALANMQLAIDQTTASMSLLESDINSLKADSESLRASIEDVNSKVDSLDSRVETLELLGNLNTGSSEDGSLDGSALSQLTVLGESVLSDTLVNGTLNVGLLSVESDEDSASLDAIGTLKLQPLALGNVEIMDGMVEVDTEGNVSIKGDVEIEGDLAVEGSVKGSTESRAIDVGVDQDASDKSIEFGSPRESAEYAVTVTPNWDTRAWVEGKSENGFTINFSSPAPDGAKIDWIIIE